MLVCWSVKGGSGTSVVAASLALLAARTRPTLLVDLAGDLPSVLGGMPEPEGPGVADWLASPTAENAALARLAVPAGPALSLLPAGVRAAAPLTAAGTPAHRWQQLAEALAGSDADVVVDAGTAVPPPALVAGATSLLVIRSCYLGLRRIPLCGATPDGLIVVREPGRALRARDLEAALHVPVLAVVEWDPAVARAVDAGLLAGRLPASLARSLQAAA